MADKKYKIYVRWNDDLVYFAGRNSLSIQDGFVKCSGAETNEDSRPVSVMIPIHAIKLIEEIPPSSTAEELNKVPDNIRMWKFGDRPPED